MQSISVGRLIEDIDEITALLKNGDRSPSDKERDACFMQGLLLADESLTRQLGDSFFWKTLRDPDKRIELPKDQESRKKLHAIDELVRRAIAQLQLPNGEHDSRNSLLEIWDGNISEKMRAETFVREFRPLLAYYVGQVVHLREELATQKSALGLVSALRIDAKQKAIIVSILGSILAFTAHYNDATQFVTGFPDSLFDTWDSIVSLQNVDIPGGPSDWNLLGGPAVGADPTSSAAPPGVSRGGPPENRSRLRSEDNVADPDPADFTSLLGKLRLGGAKITGTGVKPYGESPRDAPKPAETRDPDRAHRGATANDVFGDDGDPYQLGMKKPGPGRPGPSLDE